MKLEKIKYVLMAQDMDRAVTFYTSVFGLEPAFVSEWWSELTFGDSIVALHGGGEGARQATCLSLQVDDATAACAAISAAGGTILDVPVQREGEPIKLGKFVDSEGNEVMLTEHVGFS
ncbi:MAG: VOC family protein [Verrucomicrobium sp.]|nr:VOC family protein [Verrucomicrobium sp.]